MTISKQLFTAIKCSPVPIYRLAQLGGWARPEQLSRLIHGARRVGAADLPRLERIAAELGVRRVVVKPLVAGDHRARSSTPRAGRDVPSSADGGAQREDAAVNATRSTQHHEGRVMAGASQGSCPTA